MRNAVTIRFHEEDEFKGSDITNTAAAGYARSLRDYMLCYPDQFNPAQVHSINDVARNLARLELLNKTQITLDRVWGQQ